MQQLRNDDAKDDVNPAPDIIHQDKSILQITFLNTFCGCLKMRWKQMNVSLRLNYFDSFMEHNSLFEWTFE